MLRWTPTEHLSPKAVVLCHPTGRCNPLDVVTKWFCTYFREDKDNTHSIVHKVALHLSSRLKWVEGGPTMYMGYWPVCKLWLFPFHAAQQVLGQFRSRFIDYMDAEAVVHELVHHRIITKGHLTTIMRTPDTTQQNQYLHECLLRTCDEEALMAVCGIIIERGYPTMRTLGQDMKSKLMEGK